uniref:NADH dehydrogenase subunit 6 n=1 Tax=Pseudodiaptomus hessei TaxID=2919416 RepID=UPI002A834DC7|nr:NADH dehydrogenase subunit 6 [Pseudodiaptomus hessei]WOH21598.1 NADH dehydrogenase subunit 6 [Pseudodiaptomus hessei]
MMITMLFSLFLILMTSTLSHPISMASCLLMLAVTTGLMLFNMSASWLFYILVLVFLGGVMVVILYMTSLASNEKMFKNNKLNNMILFLMFLPLFLVLKPQNNLFYNLSSSFKFISTSYTCNNSILISICFIFLLICMVAVVKLVKFESGPLVKSL